MSPLVFVDADVLYSVTLRGWFFNLAHAGSHFSPAFEIVVTEDVIAEAVARWRDDNALAPGGVVSAMSENLRTLCTVLRDYDCEIPFPGGDEGDIHVYAAALEAGVGYLVTKDKGFHNLSDDVKDDLPFEIYHPDDFLVLVNAQSSRNVMEATRATMRHALSKEQEVTSMVTMLRKNDCPRFADVVERHLAVLAGARPIEFDKLDDAPVGA
ncbi:hypothetical protein [Microbacterium sp. KSW4-4]|uniref:hypothetical protein n=1 Tax=Microbacterium sp. KSW4-4 TaxID=2851651 RepID=UPI001FFCD83A|nr:hypothetical protein [Microbacterium sp. KSW4-4]MCK2032630.1 hypothetical protein [Microbacterium sp. KSW4-4]